jgi:hypothetical protein
MHKIMSLLVCLVVSVSLVGCSGSPALSMNKRMAYADSGATLATAVALDQVPAEKFARTQQELIAACSQLSRFLDDGKISDLPIEKAKAAIEKFLVEKGFGAYVGLVEVCFAWIDMQVVDVSKLGADNILVIKQGLDGIQRQASRAKVEWARPFGTAQVDTTKGRSLQLK